MKLKILLSTYLWAFLMLSSLRLDAQYYNFENATIGGGGYVTGLVFHPSEQNLLYARTDVGGAYRWNADLNQWKQLMLSVPEYGSVDGFALTASNPNIIYMACGNSVIKNPKDFEVLKSTDRGESWTKLGFNNIAGIERAFEGNQRDVRYIGERIAVDPANANIVFVGTKENGLWKSLNGGASWSKVNSIPNSTVFTVINHHPDATDIGYVGVRNILFDPNTISGGKTNVIYVGNYEDGLYKSTDAGNTFSKISGSPETIRRMDLSPDGSTLWATTGYSIGGSWGDGGKVYKFANGIWIDQNLTPNAPNDPMGALDVHPTDPNKVYLTAGKNGAEQKIYRTEDGGAIWYEISYHKNNRNHQGQGWWQRWLFATGPSSIAFNPFQEGEVWFASGEGVWKTDAAWTSAPLWKAEVDKIEELVGFVVVAPLSGAQVLMGSADTDGFRITDVNTAPQQRLSNLSETTDIAIVENNPNHMVRVGGHNWGKYGKGSYSTDNGITWTDFPGWPGGKPSGKVAVSANNLDKIVAIPLNSKPIYSTDRGASWQESTIDANTIVYQIWQHDHNLQADKVNGNIFYIYNRENGKFFKSENGGATFNHVNTLASQPWGNWVTVRTVPGIEKAVWASSFNGLHKSSNGGNSFTKIPNVEEVKAFSFGANPPGKSNPSLYLVGQINGQKGMFLSEDMGATFRIINRGEQKIGDGLNVTDIAASRQEFGKVFLSTGGWGLWYGSPDGLGSVNYNLTTTAQNGSVSPANGVYSSSSTVTLTATPNSGYIFTGWSGDLSGDKNPVTITMNGNKNITANFKIPELIASIKTDRTKGGAPLVVNFDGTASKDEDPNNSITSFVWNFGDGTSGTGNMVSHTYNALGTYKAILTVTNDKNQIDTTSVNILVDFIPTIQIVSPANNATFPVGTSVTLETAIDDGGENDIHRVVFFDKNWNWVHTDRTSPYTYTFTIAEGANEFRAQVFDSKGNASNTSLFTLIGELVSLSKKESFTNHPAATTSWSNGSFVGDEGLPWNYNQHQTRTNLISGKSARMKGGGWGRLETTIPDGIGSLQFDLLADGNSPARSKMEVFINNSSYGVFVPSSSTVPNTIIIENINVQGSVFLKLATVDLGVHMDNIEWTGNSGSNSYTITASSGSNGSISPGGSVVVEEGSDQTFSISPNSGYEISDVTVDGSSIGAVSSYTFTNVTANRTISASFSQATSSQSPYGGTAWAVPGLIQAEDYDAGGEGVAFHDTDAGGRDCGGRSDNVDLEQSSNDDGTCNVGWIANGEWLEYTVDIAQSGTYTIEARVAASNSAGGTYEISFSNGGTTGNVSFAGTNGWQAWTTVTTTGVSLNAGQQVMRVDMKSSGFNLNYINVVAEASGGESFTNHSATAESWSNGSFEGDNGFTWSYNQGQTRTGLMTGKSARIKAGGWGRLETTIPNGIGSLQFDLLGEGSPVNRSKIEVFVDNVSYGVFEATSATIPTTIIIGDINAQGQVPLKFTSVDFTVHLDNVSWTGGMSNQSTTTSSSALSNDQSFKSGMPFDHVSRLQEVKIYPNPARDRMTIEFGTMENATMEIVDIIGKKVAEKHHVQGSIELELPKGIYIIRLNNGSESFTSKLIFE